MRLPFIVITAGVCLEAMAVGGAALETRVLKRSDVALMYQADRGTYEEYGATVLAWGGRPTPKSLAEAKGVLFFGSVGMVTEFARYYERFPETYQEGLCRDVQGRPVKVPWLTDHQHKGIPFWWCCTRQPLFRQYLKERVIQTVQAGADGVHIDDHMGSAGGLWLGLCLCDRCVRGFQTHLQSLDLKRRERLGIGDPATFNYRETLQQWLTTNARGELREARQVTRHPLWGEWTVYQCRASATFMHELRDLAAQEAGRTVPMGANAGLLWPRHMCDYKSLDLFSAETDHEASGKRLSDLPLVAYRMADSLGRPYAATASGGDWAFIKEHNLPGLVRGWIALSYAAGHCLMAPHRQWCYTPQKGTHWYQGPAEKFAPLYRFVRRHPKLFDQYRNHADVGIVLPHQSYRRNTGRWFKLFKELAAANVSYRILLAGDDIVDHPLTGEALASCPALLLPEQAELLAADRRLVEAHSTKLPVFESASTFLKEVQPAVRVKADGTVRVLPRTKPGGAAIHLLNYEYDPSGDTVIPLQGVGVEVDWKKLKIPREAQLRCRLFTAEGGSKMLDATEGRVVVPDLGLWGILVFEGQP